MKRKWILEEVAKLKQKQKRKQIGILPLTSL